MAKAVLIPGKEKRVLVGIHGCSVATSPRFPVRMNLETCWTWYPAGADFLGGRFTTPNRRFPCG